MLAAHNSPQERAAITVLLVAAFTVILNETVLNVAIPKISTDLQINTNTAQWLITAFMLTMGVLIPTTGFLLQKFTTRTVFFAAMGLFCCGTLIAGCAPDFPVLLLGRVVQASGTGLMMPLLMTVILTLVPPERRGAAMGTVVIVIAVAPAIGPTLSGLILGFFHHWRFIFLVILPIALATTAFGAKTLTNVTELRDPILDVISVPLSAVAFGTLVYGCNIAGDPTVGWTSPRALIPIGVGIVALALFVWRQFTIETPLLDLRAFRYKTYALAVVIMATLTMAFFATFLPLPIYLEQIRAISSLQTGLILLPGGVVMGFSSPIIGRILDKYGPRALTIGGAILLEIALWSFSTISTSTPIALIVMMNCALALSISLLMTPVQTTGLNQLPSHLHSHGTAIISTTQQVAGAIGTALIITLMALATAGYIEGLQIAPKELTTLQQNAAILVGIQKAYASAAVIALVPLVLVPFLKRTVAPARESADGEPESEELAFAVH